MQRTNIYLEEAQSRALDDVARSQGISRAELVRRLVDQGLDEAGHRDLEADLAAIEEAFGVLVGAPAGETSPAGRLPDDRPPAGWGPDDRSRHLDRVGRR